jgi:hypothetical protein
LEGKPAYLNFIHSVKSQATKKQYDIGLKRYMGYGRAITVDEMLYLKGTEGTTAPIKKSSNEIESQIISFVVHLRDVDKISHSLQVSYLASITNFYPMNDVILNRKKIGKYLGERTRVSSDRAFSHEEIAKLLAFCYERQYSSCQF